MTKQIKTSWESSASWYDEVVGQQGHYYHEHVILPKLLELMQLKKGAKILDLACGQGILARALPKNIKYMGVDLSKTLIRAAKVRTKNPLHTFLSHDVTKKLPFPKGEFSHAAVLLALQNIEDPMSLLKNAYYHLADSGVLFLVLNHPCFRIPRQSHWGIDEKKKLQYRRMDSYLSPQKIPIQTHPGKNKGQTLSFHYSLSKYSQMLKETGFAIFQIEEWISDKKSMGGKARMENRARREFPLFLTLVCQKT
ncbi:MAG: Demethylmenaquinone methyltransferase [Chlamydiae bacterium]|nr:Demethylmenaquinone methyltransferase [Chlamydiota bacterium]